RNRLRVARPGACVVRDCAAGNSIYRSPHFVLFMLSRVVGGLVIRLSLSDRHDALHGAVHRLVASSRRALARRTLDCDAAVSALLIRVSIVWRVLVERAGALAAVAGSRPGDGFRLSRLADARHDLQPALAVFQLRAREQFDRRGTEVFLYQLA